MWTVDVVDELVSRWNDGQSAEDISRSYAQNRRLDFSRAAVVGKVKRLRDAGIALRGGHVRKSPRKIAADTAMRAEISEAPPTLPMPEMEMELAPLIGSILDLEDHHCRYMHGDAKDGKYCGRTAVRNGSWCKGHHKRVWGQVD